MEHPKQLLPLTGELTMLQATALRARDSGLSAHVDVAAPIVVGNEQYRFITAEQLRQIGVQDATLVLEPTGRNTAPALTLAALLAADAGNDPVMLVMPADHVITDMAAFGAAVLDAVDLAARGHVVTFGIVPTAPETGYGYIELGVPLSDGAARHLARFVEKPDRATAQAYLDSGNFLWNSGMFVVTASRWLRAIERARPDIAQACEGSVRRCTRDHDFLRVEPASFAACPSESIDYAVMESLSGVESDPGGVVVPLDAGWSDVGAWTSLLALGANADDGNLLVGDVLALDCEHTMARSEGRLVACIGLRDVIVVETADAVLVAARDQVQRVKDVVARLHAEGRREARAHRKAFRPWGHYDSIDSGSRFQVKRIVVKPGGSLSLQMHHHRAEHWIVVRGTARITRGEETFLLSENESTFIPLGTRHRLENPGKVALEMIEVQSGSYLGEDDIVRFEDHYGRG